jgi:acetyl-CoA synthetase
MKWTFDIKPTTSSGAPPTSAGSPATPTSPTARWPAAPPKIVFEGVPTYPDAGRFWKMIQDHKVSIFYTAPTAIRSLIKAGDANPRPSEELRPVQPAHPGFGRRADQSGSLDVVLQQRRRRPLPDRRHLLADRNRRPHDHPAAGRHALVPGSCTLPFPGIQAAIVDETGNDVPWGKGGFLVVKKPWPSMIRTIWGDPERFKKSYLPGRLRRQVLPGRRRRHPRRQDRLLHHHGPHRRRAERLRATAWARWKSSRRWWPTRWWPKPPWWAVRRPDRRGDLRLRGAQAGPRPVGDEAKKIATELRNWVGKEIGPIAKPKDIRFGDNLPKTRSGKIMRRLLRSIAKGEEITQDVSTLEKSSAAILDQLKSGTRDISAEGRAMAMKRSIHGAAPGGGVPARLRAVQLSDHRPVQQGGRAVRHPAAVSLPVRCLGAADRPDGLVHRARKD